VAHNGAESARSRRITEQLGVDVHTLPSTSPANASWSFERKLAAWRDVFSRYDLAPSQTETIARPDEIPRQQMEPATMSEQDGVRYLHLGTPWVQGAMRVRKPQAIELEYVQRMMAWMLWRPQDEVDQGHAVQLGLGAASITRFTHKAMRMRTTAVELNPTVISACRMWFQLPADDARLQVVEADAGAGCATPRTCRAPTC
jgi:hypothetical protein